MRVWPAVLVCVLVVCWAPPAPASEGETGAEAGRDVSDGAASVGGAEATSSVTPPPDLIRPFRFALVCAWSLACLYCAAWARLRSDVPAVQKPALSLLLLLTGPAGWAGWVFVRQNPSLRAKLDDVLTRLTRYESAATVDPTQAVSIELCNSDGASVDPGRGRNSPGSETLEVAKRIIHEGLERRASDILIDPRSGEMYLVRYRVDGILHDVASFPADQGVAIVNCLKVAAQLDISEKRRPQDGAFIARLPDREIKFRSATAGTLYGEKIAVRIFDVQAGLKDLNGLGLPDPVADQIARYMRRSDGMLLIAGPTGSGKTTTIYAALSLLVGQGRNIITIEDPIEYPLEHASQTEVNPKANITFAGGLRSILRQDPDVILVGEIRDAETAETALQASQTGHLVLSTVHSNDGPTALARLLDFGIEPFLISTGLTAVLSQRLVRVLCSACKRPARISGAMRREAARRQIALGKISVAVGCDLCDGTGYLGRTGIFEVLPLSKKMGHLLTKAPSLATIQVQTRAEEMILMRQSGMAKVLMGETTVEEILRVTT